MYIFTIYNVHTYSFSFIYIRICIDIYKSITYIYIYIHIYTYNNIMFRSNVLCFRNNGNFRGPGGVGGLEHLCVETRLCGVWGVSRGLPPFKYQNSEFKVWPRQRPSFDCWIVLATNTFMIYHKIHIWNSRAINTCKIQKVRNTTSGSRQIDFYFFAS